MHRLLGAISAAVVAVVVVAPASGQTTAATRVGVVRPVPGDAATLVETARRRSPTVARQLQALEASASDLVVYIEIHVGLRGGVGQMTLLTAAGGVRRVRIALEAHLGTRDQIVVLGHELHHAIEIGGAPEVQDEVTLRAFYQEAGFRVGRQCAVRFDTQQAREIARTVAQEVDTLRGVEGAWGRSPDARAVAQRTVR